VITATNVVEVFANVSLTDLEVEVLLDFFVTEGIHAYL
jgi:hypothetical protein